MHNVETVPGVTKFMQEVYLDKFIRLLDVPSIVPEPSSELSTILCNCIQVQKLADPVTPCSAATCMSFPTNTVSLGSRLLSTF